MARSLFDPSKAAGGEQAAPSAGSKQFTVSQAVNLIKETLETVLPSPLHVVGEISNFKSSNHWYFSLKDAEAVLHCVAWATAVRKFGFVPKDGDQILATGHISHFPPQGKTQLYVSAMQPVGAGSLELQFRALCNQLRGLGYFDEDRKKPLPLMPRRVAVITSATGAAIQDVIKTAAQRCKAVGLVLVDVRVQGEGAPEEIARAIRWVDANRAKLGVDAMLVTRGGGSIEDLSAFNERIVADAVFRATLPIVAAIGHESDTTIIELVADVRASTPTQAAMRLIPSAKELSAQVEHLVHRFGALLKRRVDQEHREIQKCEGDLRRVMQVALMDHRARLERVTLRLKQAHPGAVILRQRAELTRLSLTMRQAANRHVSRLRERAVGAERHLSAIDPYGVLKRGYSLTTDRHGELIRSVKQAGTGDALTTRVSDGSIHSIVAVSPSGAAGKPKLQRRDALDQLDLFAGGDSTR